MLSDLRAVACLDCCQAQVPVMRGAGLWTYGFEKGCRTHLSINTLLLLLLLPPR